MIRSRLRELRESSPSSSEIQGRLRRIERSTLRHAHRFIIRRISNLRDVKRHAISWLVLVAVIAAAAFWQSDITTKYYSTPVAAEGGVYTEGVVGSIDNINPIFASSPAERAASRLIFAGLLTYDDKGDLVGELASHWKTEDGGRIYTVTLKQNAKWEDGVPLTADDVVFTFAAIKNADTKSPLYSSWRNITVEKVDDLTVRFTLPSAYAAFLNSLTVGILPEHVLKTIRPSELRTDAYSRSPVVGSGPFVFRDLRAADTRQTHYLLRAAANKLYIGGQPKLESFHLHAYKDREDLAKAFRAQEIASMSDATSDQLQTLGSPSGYVQINAPLYNGVFAFLKTDNPTLSDVRVRKALQYATNQTAILDRLNNRVQPLSGPLLPGQLGYRADAKQPENNIEAAQKLLDEAGWAKGENGKRTKDGQPVRLRLITISSGDYPAVVEELIKQWQKLGIEFEAPLIKAEEIQQNNILPRAYDILVYEIALGRDPDVYAYWHSSQASERGLNLSNYKSAKVDDALDSARVRLESQLREVKYRLFVQQWLADVPAIALYRPTLTYIQNKNVVTFDTHPLVSPTDRYFNIRSWAAGREQLRMTR